jgi:hypothetical protein
MFFSLAGSPKNKQFQIQILTKSNGGQRSNLSALALLSSPRLPVRVARPSYFSQRIVSRDLRVLRGFLSGLAAPPLHALSSNRSVTFEICRDQLLPFLLLSRILLCWHL